MPEGGRVVDLGCGTGVSSRRIAQKYPHSTVLGLDLSPHFIAVGRRLLDLGQGQGQGKEQAWVNDLSDVAYSSRVTLRCADAAVTGLADASCDVVCLSLVIHELPAEATRAISAEVSVRVWLVDPSLYDHYWR